MIIMTKKRQKHICLSLLVALTAFFCHFPTMAEDEAVRQGKVTLTDTLATLQPIDNYSFLNLKANIIDLKGNNWEKLYKELCNSNKHTFSIVHIGDSHLQADVGSGRVRELLQENFGNAGRGLICPLKICGTNEPYTYTFSTSTQCITSRLLKRPWATDMGFTGTTFTPQTATFDITLSTSTTRNPYGSPFDRIRIFASAPLSVTLVANEDNILLTPIVKQSDYYTDILLSQPVVTAKLTLYSLETVNIYGASLHNGNYGVEYHTIGNNGATFATYNELRTVGFDISHFKPDLVILSLGTNEAFSNITNDQLEADIDYMIANILKHNPDAAILLTTPMECQKTKVSYSYTKKRRKKKRRKVRHTSMVINTKVKQMRDVIIKYADENNIPVYDFYTVAGGDNASKQWAAQDLMARDHIHNSYKGYLLQGDLFYNALINVLKNYDGNIK